MLARRRGQLLTKTRMTRCLLFCWKRLTPALSNIWRKGSWERVQKLYRLRWRKTGTELLLLFFIMLLFWVSKFSWGFDALPVSRIKAFYYQDILTNTKYNLRVSLCVLHYKTLNISHCWLLSSSIELLFHSVKQVLIFSLFYLIKLKKIFFLCFSLSIFLSLCLFFFFTFFYELSRHCFCIILF